jgi:hypothetical protein
MDDTTAASEVSNWMYNDDLTWTNVKTNEKIEIERTSGPFDVNNEYCVFVTHKHADERTQIDKTDTESLAREIAHSHASQYNTRPSATVQKLMVGDNDDDDDKSGNYKGVQAA